MVCETDNGMTLMAADTPADMQHNPGNNVAISLSGEERRRTARLLAEAFRRRTVTMPLEKQMWGDEFGMCIDEFGVTWMVNITQPRPDSNSATVAPDVRSRRGERRGTR